MTDTASTDIKPKADKPRARKRVLEPKEPQDTTPPRLQEWKAAKKQKTPEQPKAASKGKRKWERAKEAAEAATAKLAQEEAEAEARCRKVGRPTEWTQELQDQICELIACRIPVHEIVLMPGMPNQRTLFRWKALPCFQVAYTRAREHRAESRSDYMDLIAQKCLRGEIAADVARVIIENEKWLASRENQRLYGDKTTAEINAKVEVTNNPEGNLELARFCDRIASDNVEKIIDQRVAEGKLIRVDSLLHRQQRSLPSPSHAPSSTVIDLVATPIINGETEPERRP